MSIPMIAFHPKLAIIKSVPQCHGAATIRTGGAAKCVRVPPTEILTKRRPSVAYANLGDGFFSKNFLPSNIAAIVIAAGSVMNEPRIGVIENSHHVPDIAVTPSLQPKHFHLVFQKNKQLHLLEQ